VPYGGADAEKQRIRSEVGQISETLDPAYLREAIAAITRKVLALPAWKKAKAVMAYVSLAKEPDTRAILEAALAEGKTLLLPRCVDGRNMLALPVSDLSALVPGKLGIPEPPPPEEGMVPPEPDLILVPCVAAAPNGVRLGHGAGYYDRFLAEHPAQTVCLCFRRLLRADLPADVTDILTDMVLTDEGIDGEYVRE